VQIPRGKAGEELREAAKASKS